MPGLRDFGLVERDNEGRVIEAAVEETRAGGSRLLVIEGPPGIGKTRLVSLARERARAAGFDDLFVRAGELERSFAFGAVRGLFELRIASLGDDERERVLSGQARVALRALGLDRRPSTRPDAMQAVLGGLYWLCVGLAHERPLLLAIDDAHWCDEASLRWLAYALPRLEGMPVLIALGTRPSEPGTDAPVSIARLARAESAEILTPAPLSRHASDDLMGRALGGTPARPVLDACYEATAGSPFLLHELITEIQAGGLGSADLDAPRVAGLGSRRISEGVLARVRRIGADAELLTRCLAVLGDGAQPAIATALSGLSEQRTVAAAAGLVDAGVLVEGFPLAFSHPLVRSAIYEHLAYADRLAGHARAARLLDDADAEPEAVAAHLLFLAPNGEDWIVGVQRRAAAVAVTRGSPHEAVRFLRRALEEPPPDSIHGSVLAELGVAEHNAEDPGAVDHLYQALGLTEDAGERARIGLVLARAIWHERRVGDAVGLLDWLIGEVGEQLAGPLQAELVAIARLDPRTRKIGLRALANSETDDFDEDAGRLLLLANLCFERAVAGEMSAEAVVELGRRALADGVLLAQEGSESTIYHLAAWALAQCDRFGEAEKAFDAAVELARQEGSAVGFARALTFRCELNYRRGLLDEAEADGGQALEHLTPIRAPLAVAFMLDVLIERDELPAAEKMLALYELDGDVPGSILHTIVLERRGRLRLAQAKHQGAVADLSLCAERAAEWGAGSPAFLSWRSSLALALASVERSQEARELVDQELERARRFGTRRALGVALRAKALLEPRPQDAELLVQAACVLKDSGAQLEYARALVDLGAALRRSGQRTAARERLRTGLALAQRAGAVALARRARVELRSAGGRPVPRDRGGVESLTPAELRVARMAAEGLSNRDIAQALFVTPKTVEWHLSQAYRRLGLRSRGELPAALKQDEENRRVA